MLNALSSTLKNDSDDQSRKAPPTMPSAAAFDWIARTALRIESTEVLGNVFVELADEERALVGLMDEPEQRERQEEQRHEREQREVGDHRRQVRAPVGEELADHRSHGRGSMLGPMDAAQAIADLTEISPQVQDVVVVAADGALRRLERSADAAAETAREGAQRAARRRPTRSRPGVAQLEAATVDGQRLRRPRRRAA